MTRTTRWRAAGVLAVLALAMVAMLLSSGQMSDLRIAWPLLSRVMSWLEGLPLPVDMDHVAFFAALAILLRLLLPHIRTRWLFWRWACWRSSPSCCNSPLRAGRPACWMRATTSSVPYSGCCLPRWPAHAAHACGDGSAVLPGKCGNGIQRGSGIRKPVRIAGRDVAGDLAQAAAGRQRFQDAAGGVAAFAERRQMVW